jgi:hypothetical protein
MILYCVSHKYHILTKCKHEMYPELFDNLEDAMQFCRSKVKSLVTEDDVIEELNSVLTKPGIMVSQNNKLVHKFTITKLTYQP